MSETGQDRTDAFAGVPPVSADPVNRLRTALERIAFAIERRKALVREPVEVAPPEPQIVVRTPDLTPVLEQIDGLIAGVSELLESCGGAPEPSAGKAAEPVGAVDLPPDPLAEDPAESEPSFAPEETAGAGHHSEKED